MPLELIGAGLGRTGTVSLKLAPEPLGFGRCDQMTELFVHMDHAPRRVQAAAGHPDWDGVFAGYAATVDYPGYTFWRESTQTTIFTDASSTTLQASPLREFFEKTVWRDIGTRLHDRDFMVDLFRRVPVANARFRAGPPKDRSAG